MRYTIELNKPEDNSCEARISATFGQWNTVARVETTIENSKCAASRGDYAIVIRVKDANGDTQTLEFNESWQRDDDQPIHAVAEYPIGDNVDLTGVRPRAVKCECLGVDSASDSAIDHAAAGTVADPIE